jgi:hypothetical protein
MVVWVYKFRKKASKKFDNIGETKDGIHLWLLSGAFRGFL